MRRYQDPTGWETYDQMAGQELIQLQVLVPCNVSDAFDAWMDLCWHSTYARIIQKGSGRKDAVKSIRQVPGGIHEQITRVGDPSLTDSCKEYSIASVSYRVISGPFPVRDHLGFIRFIPDVQSRSRSTLVCWNVKIVPSMIGHVFCCGGTLIRLMSRQVINQTLQTYAAILQARHGAQR